MEIRSATTNIGNNISQYNNINNIKYKSGKNIHHIIMAITSATIMATRSAKIIGNNISQYINYILYGLTSAINLIISPLILQGKPTL